jgi:CRISPR-associated exonuclease Cas4
MPILHLAAPPRDDAPDDVPPLHAGEGHAARSLLSEEDALVPIRMIEALAYCPRQAWYRFVAGDDPLNLHMERGLRRHATMDETPLPPLGPELRVYRHLAVVAPRLGVTGVLDEVIVAPDMLTITEYKATRRRAHVSEGVALQLAVQHLALREHAASTVWFGPPMPAATALRVYLADSRRYQEVPWTPELEERARTAIAHSRAILALASPPPGNVGARCTHCQHEPVCLPTVLPILMALPPEEGIAP